jgi:hypothetical protein
VVVDYGNAAQGRCDKCGNAVYLGESHIHTVVETGAYLRSAEAAGMTDEERAEVVDRLARNPQAGRLIVGSGGCRKLRVGGRGKGKSGGYRVVTYYAGTDFPVFLVAALSKGSAANFSAAQVNAMAKAVATIKDGIGRRVVKE